MDWHVQSSLIWLAISGLIFWYLKYLWSRRKLYIYSWNVPGPLNLPFIGAGYALFLNPQDMTKTVVKTIGSYTPLSKTWFGPQLIYSSQDADVVGQILANQKQLEKDSTYQMFRDFLGNGLLNAPTEKWKKHRKLIMPSFSQKVLDGFVKTFSEQAAIFTDVLKRYVDTKKIDISVPASALTMDIVCETAMGLKMNTQGGNYKFAKTLERLMFIITLRLFQIQYRIHWLFRLLPVSREMDKCIKFIHETTLKIIRKKKEERQKDTSNAKDAFVAQVEEEGKKRLAFLDLVIDQFTEKELQDEVMILLVAGTDTFATMVCFCLEMMGLFPEVQQKVYEEVIDVVGEERPVEASDLPNLKYTERFIKETLRLFPAVVFFARRITEDTEIGDYVLPEGSTFLFSSINVHRNPKHWPDPLRFDPDRFLPEEVAKRPPCAYIPFSYGVRNCIGHMYAMMGLKTIVATTIREYRMFTHYKSIKEMEIIVKIVLRLIDGHKVYLERR